ncbi:MAG TPA: HPF/RaiA family ribosome-associated protein [Polyangia bacterium]
MAMQIEVRGGEGGWELQEQVERRLRFALGRFGHWIRGVIVRLVDLNGPKGGVDKRCRVEVRGGSRRAIVVESTDASVLAAVDDAAARAARSVGRAMERARGR